MDSSIKITVSDGKKPDLKKWEVLNIGAGMKNIVIRVRPDGKYALTVTVVPYKKFNRRWKRVIWFWWLKLRVSIGDFYKK